MGKFTVWDAGVVLTCIALAAFLAFMFAIPSEPPTGSKAQIEEVLFDKMLSGWSGSSSRVILELDNKPIPDDLFERLKKKYPHAENGTETAFLERSLVVKGTTKKAVVLTVTDVTFRGSSSAYAVTESFCGMLCATGTSYGLRRTPDGWEIHSEELRYVS
jgi:hypothetical protein